MENEKIAIIIPFYQEMRGLLSKAVISVFHQKGVQDFKIIVVDDGSPISAAEELRTLMVQYPHQIRIIKQANSGPASARNKALDSLSEETEYVAFLDSDDEWKESHLQKAIDALTRGYDFYFSDFTQSHENRSRFEINQFISSKSCQMLDASKKIYEYKGDYFDEIIQDWKNSIRTSTVVFRYSTYSDIRFSEGQFVCEDLLFFIDCFNRVARIVFSSACECFAGEGVNIWNKSMWEGETAMRRIFNQIQLMKVLERDYAKNEEQKKRINEKIRHLRRDCIANILHAIRHHNHLKQSWVRKILAIDPWLLMLFIPEAVKIIFLKFKKTIANSSSTGMMQ